MATVVPLHSVRRAAAPVARLIVKVWLFVPSLKVGEA